MIIDGVIPPICVSFGYKLVTYAFTVEGLVNAVPSDKIFLPQYINSIDDAPPIVNLDSNTDNKIVLFFEDTQSGVDYDGIYGLDSAGKKIMPSLIDEGTSTVTFNYDGLYIEVHVPDKAGHEAIANFGAEASFDTVAAESGE